MIYFKIFICQAYARVFKPLEQIFAWNSVSRLTLHYKGERRCLICSNCLLAASNAFTLITQCEWALILSASLIKASSISQCKSFINFCLLVRASIFFLSTTKFQIMFNFCFRWDTWAQDDGTRQRQRKFTRHDQLQPRSKVNCAQDCQCGQRCWICGMSISTSYLRGVFCTY